MTSSLLAMMKQIRQTKENLLVRFQMNELGELKHFLGLEVNRTEEGLFLCQRKYAIDLLQRFGMLECKPISTPMEANAKFCAHVGQDLQDRAMYRQGTLFYKKSDEVKIVGYCNADYAGDHDTR
ncbi:hypothetical protein CsatA_009227 [Cannabis sativa]